LTGLTGFYRIEQDFYLVNYPDNHENPVNPVEKEKEFLTG
jgi:hypothetical protein